MKTLMKIIFLPARLILLGILTLIWLTADLISGISGIIFHVIGLIMLLTIVCCWGFGLESGSTVINMFVSSAAVFLIPQIIGLIAGIMELLTELLAGTLAG